MRKLFLGTGLLGLMLALGCDQKIDASSHSTFEESTRKISESLDGEKRERFDKAIMTLGLNANFTPGDPRDSLKKTFDGKTADEIIAEGEKLQAENKKEMDKLMRGE